MSGGNAECGFLPCSECRDGLLLCHSPAAKTNNIGIIILLSEFRSLSAIGNSSAYPFYLIGSDTTVLDIQGIKVSVISDLKEFVRSLDFSKNILVYGYERFWEKAGDIIG